MEAKEIKLLKFIRNANQFTIPVYQRTYSWSYKKNCHQLWEDILEAGSKKTTTYFFGAVVYIGPPHQVAKHQPLFVIDGQQKTDYHYLVIGGPSSTSRNQREHRALFRRRFARRLPYKQTKDRRRGT